MVNAMSEARKIEPISLRRRTNIPRLFRARSANLRSFVECRLASPFVRYGVGTMFCCGTGALRVISAPRLQKGIPDGSQVRYLPAILSCGFAWGQPPANTRCNSCTPYYACASTCCHGSYSGPTSFSASFGADEVQEDLHIYVSNTTSAGKHEQARRCYFAQRMQDAMGTRRRVHASAELSACTARLG